MAIHLSYWLLPIISGLVWLGMLLGMLIYWLDDTHREHYPSMNASATIAYISDVGASTLKPLFIAGCVVAAVFLNLSFGADRWLRHKGRLVPNSTVGEKVLMGLTIFFAVVGSLGLILLSIFDAYRHKKEHDIFLLVFIGGYLLSAIFLCWEYQRLGIRNRNHRVLRISFWIKLVFVIVELVLAIAYVSTTWTARYNAGAVVEWTIAFIFSLYIFSFVVDLYPAVYTKPKGARYDKPSTGEVEEARHGHSAHSGMYRG